MADDSALPTILQTLMNYLGMATNKFGEMANATKGPLDNIMAPINKFMEPINNLISSLQAKLSIFLGGWLDKAMGGAAAPAPATPSAPVTPPSAQLTPPPTPTGPAKSGHAR